MEQLKEQLKNLVSTNNTREFCGYPSNPEISVTPAPQLATQLFSPFVDLDLELIQKKNLR